MAPLATIDQSLGAAAAKLRMRVRHGHHGVTDPFAQRAWLAKAQVDSVLWGG